MKRAQSTFLVVIFCLINISAFATNGDHPGEVFNDTELVQATESQRNAFYIEAGNLTVTKILPDDTSGLPHQKWQTRLSNGKVVTIVYNSDMGDRVPVEIGDKFSVGGQYIYYPNGGVVHWLHDDPRGRRPDGYVFLNGIIYGDTDHEDTPVRH